MSSQPNPAQFAPGMLESGNIDLSNRPQVRNADGSVSSVRSIGVNVDGQEVLIPTVSDDGRVMSDQEAIDMFMKTGRHLGKFDTPEHSTAYGAKVHEDQAKMIKPVSAPSRGRFLEGFFSGRGY